MSRRAIWSLLGRRRAGPGLRLAFMAMLCLAVTGGLCWLSTRRFTRMDWTRKVTGLRGRYELHQRTVQLLRSLETGVDVTVLYHMTGDPRQDRYIALWLQAATDMLAEFAAYNGRLSLRRIDTALHPDRLEKLRQRLDVPRLPDYCTVFETRDGHETVPYQAMITAVGDRLVFSGEAAFCEALRRLAGRGRSIVYMLTDRPPGEFSRLRQALAGANYRIEPLRRGEAVPGDCAALLIAVGGQRAVDAPWDAIRDYLELRQGGAVVLVGPDPNGHPDDPLHRFLIGYGVGARTDATAVAPVFNPYGKRIGQRTDLRVGVRDVMVSHPAAAGVTGAPARFERCCPLMLAEDAESLLTVQPLLAGIGPNWGETEYAPGASGPLLFYDAGQDVPAPVIVGAVVEPRAQEGAPGTPGVRLAVLASVESFADAYASEHEENVSLVTSCVDWIARAQAATGPVPRLLESRVADLSTGQVLAARWIFIAALPGCLIALGVTVWAVRRR